MSTLTMDKVRTGEAEFVTRNVGIDPGRHTFADQADLDAYLVKVMGGKAASGGVTGFLSRKGRYMRRSNGGVRAVTFGDPVLDAISSPAGTLEIGGKTIDLARGHPAATALHGAGSLDPAAPAVPFDDPALTMTGVVQDAERWISNDGSYVEYRIRNGRLGLHAWKENYTILGYGYWSMGLEISVWNTPCKYEVANIPPMVLYMTVTAPCQMFDGGSASDADNTYVDQMAWGIHAQQPERVAGVCQARWHHRNFVEVVTAGESCLRYKTDPWPLGFPADWTPIATIGPLDGGWTDGSGKVALITTTRRAFSIDMSAFGRPAASGTITGYQSITATFPDDRTYTGELTSARTIAWSNGSTWTKVVNTVLDLSGDWTDGSPWIAVINAGPTSLAVEMSDFDRPDAHGAIDNPTTITVTFPDDKTYTATLQAPNVIRWSNGSTWTRKA